MIRERPQTAQAARKGSASPYNSLPGSAGALGLQVRPKTAHVVTTNAQFAEGGKRSVYVRAPRPPGGLREYGPLRPRAQSGGYPHRGEGKAWQEEDWGGDDQLQFDAVRADGKWHSNTVRKPPPMSARGRLQSDIGHQRPETVYRLPSAESESIHDDDEGTGQGDVAIFPAPHRQGFIPPQPLMHDPSPRRRPMSAQVSGTTSRDLLSIPSIAEPSSHVHASRAERDGPAVASQFRGALCKDMAPVITAIASLTHETHLGKLARQIDAVVLVLLEADASRVSLYNQHHAVLYAIKPGESDQNFMHSNQNQYEVEGITGLCAQSEAPVNVPDLHNNQDVKLECDVGLNSLPATHHVSYLAVPARDKNGDVVAVISAVRMGLQAKPFDDECVQIMQMVAQQAGIAVSQCLQRIEMQRTKIQSKILVKAAVELTSAADLEIGSLTLLASTYARKLADCDSALVCISHERHRLLRTWTMTDGEVQGDKRDKSLSAGEVHLEERSHIPCPPLLKKVATTGSVANMLVHGRAARPEHGELARLNELDIKATSVIEGTTLEFQRNSDSFLAVPLQTEPGGHIMGMMIASNKFGGPRKAGRSGVFTPLDEEVLRELANIVSAVLFKIMRVTDLESAIAMAPSITRHKYAHLALNEICKSATKPLKADRVLVFTLEEDGNYRLHHAVEEEKGTTHTNLGWSQKNLLQTSAQQAPVRLSANSYPLAAAAQSRTALRVRIHDVSEVIVNKKSGLLSHAADMLACPIRDPEGNLYGIMVAATLKQDFFPDYCISLLGDINAQLGAVLQRCGHFEQQLNHIGALKHASREMLHIVNKREIKTVIDYVHSQVSDFMCCGRAVLYIVDRQQHVVWTLAKMDGDEETIITYDIKSDVDPDTEGSRVGYVNAALYEGKTVVVKDFAYGQHAYNDMLDSADIKHVQKLLKIQSGAYDAATTAVIRAELEPEQRTESIATIPVHDSEGEVIAILQVMNRWKSQSAKKIRKEGFDHDDIDKLELVAAAVSSTLETSARLNRQWEREHELRSLINSADDGIKVGMGATCRVNLNDALSYVAKCAYSRCGASQVAVYLLDDEGQMDIIRFEGNLFVPCQRVKAPIAGIAGHTIRQGKTFNLVDAHQHPMFRSDVDEKMLLPAFSMVSCPIRDPNGKVLGALSFQNKKSSPNSIDDTDPFRAHGIHTSRKAIMVQGHASGWQQFNKCDERVLESGAQGLGVALTQFVLFDNISNVSERLKDISRELELDRTCETIANSCRQLCKAGHCMVFLLDDKTGDMLCRMQDSGNFRIPGNYGIPGAVRSRGGTIFCRSTTELQALAADDRQRQKQLAPTLSGVQLPYSLERYDRDFDGLWNSMGVAMVDMSGRIVGVLEIGNKVGRTDFTHQDERLIKVIASHAYTMIKHCLTYEAIVAKVEGNKEIITEVVGLVKEVSATFPQTLEFSTAYRDIVESTCKVMGAARGRLYISIPGSHHMWMAYDRDGKQVKERSSQSAARVIEGGTLINNTKLPTKPTTGVEDTGHQGDRATPSENELKESKLMCAPVTTIDPFYKEGLVVIGALEVEAHFGHEFKGHEEELLQYMADTTSALLDIMRQIRTSGDKEKKKGVGLFQATISAPPTLKT